MAKIRKPKVTKSELSQTINLKEIFGKNFKNQPALKEAIGQALIDKMVDRTQSGKSVTGKNLKSPYSKQYADTLEFKAAGKSKGNVNMTLTGDMLRSIDILDVGANTITIGIDDPDEAPKSFNHQTGDTVPRRPFFGVQVKEVNEVEREFRSELNQAFKKRGENRSSAIEAFLLQLLRDTDGEG